MFCSCASKFLYFLMKPWFLRMFWARVRLLTYIIHLFTFGLFPFNNFLRSFCIFLSFISSFMHSRWNSLLIFPISLVYYCTCSMLDDQIPFKVFSGSLGFGGYDPIRFNNQIQYRNSLADLVKYALIILFCYILPESLSRILSVYFYWLLKDLLIIEYWK